MKVPAGSDFDDVWEEWSNASLMLVREAADMFAKSGENALAPDLVVATLLWILAVPRPASLYFYASRPKWPLRYFDGAFRPPLAEESLERLASLQQCGNCAEVVMELTDVMSAAAKEWSFGNPEQPDSREVLRQLFALLWARRLIPRPPAKAYPRGV
jgi:hypothetical protein